ncbi:MAG: response regulator [Rhodospirillales bacterium]|nr:response regulator [Rhodospirillales bacterium]
MGYFADNALMSKIVIIDDNPTNVALLEDMLDEEGYENLVCFTDPREALSHCQNEEVDLILLDIRMPHLNGIQLMEQLADKIHSEYLPIIVLTAQKDAETRENALRVGANDFLNKPFEQWEVLLRIHNTLVTRMLYSGQRNRAEELEALVQERTKEIRKTQLEIIRSLGRAGEFRDNETGAHVIRVSLSSQLLALKSGVSETQAELLMYASPMHDAGKIGIPDRILLKPGKLDEEEWEIMKTHAEKGAEIIGDHDSEVIRLARTLAIAHHERWDGTGYPKGTKGETIPIEARILSICDVFDALTSARPYKSPWSIESALNLIKEESGKAFDPTLVENFIGIVDQITSLRNTFPDND